ncbi:MAG: TonB-dependent receptor [Bacteroidales bacterium]|nr:TonB-dependent receptor [Bacteroidales bacterium]
MKSLAKKLIAVLLCLGTGLSLSAQTTVTGIVTDENGEPLIGAGVFVEGTTIGAVTGLDGDYELVVPADAVNLVYSFIGLADQTVAIAGRTRIDVQLSADTTFLDEVVVIGYAAVKRRDLMGSVSSVDSKSLTAVPVTSVSEALTGKMAGVQVTTTEGDPDADIKIRVRGSGSITQDSSPLYIVDGFPVESINDIPSSDIQSIDILKDAFSTAIYGSRGANGVVLVTTKSGAEGKVSVTYNAYTGFKKMANKDAIQPMSSYDYVRTVYEMAMMDGKLDTQYVPYFGVYDDMDMYKNAYTNDWVEQVFGRTGSTFNQNVSISGGSEKVKWTASYAHVGDKAIMVGSNFKRDNLAFKTRYEPVKKLTFDFNARYSNTSVRGAGANSMNDTGSSSSNGRLKHAVQYTPLPILAMDSESDMEEDYGDNVPPLQSVADNDTRRFRKNWTVNGAVTWHIIDNLDLKVEGGLDDWIQTDDHFYGVSTYYSRENSSVKNQPANQHKDSYRKKYRNTNTLNYNFKDLIKDKAHKLDILIGQEYILTKANVLSLNIDGFPDFYDAETAWNFMSSGTPNKASNFFEADDKLLSFFGRANYVKDDKYSFSATLRADGSSRFSKGHQWGLFPSFAAAWTISNEDFMKDATKVDNLKLRYSFGTAGNNNIPTGVTQMAFTSSNTTWVYGTKTMFNTTTVGGKYIMPNEDLTWETTYSHNIGLDFSFLRSRVKGSAEVYSNLTDNLLIQFPTAGSGYEYQYRNMGAVRNRGAEFSLDIVLAEKKDWGITAGANISFNKNRVTKLGLDSIQSSSGWGGTYVANYDYIVQVGQPLGNIYGYICDGRYEASDFTWDGARWVLNDGVVDASGVVGGTFGPGSLKLKDIGVALDEDGNPVADNIGMIDSNDLTVIGNTQPKAVGGFNISAFCKGFDFSANFNFVLGNQIYNANKIEFTTSRSQYRRNYLSSFAPDSRWTNINWETGELITDPDKLAAVNAGTTLWSPNMGRYVLTDWAIEDGSFLRLSTITMGYTLNQELTRKYKLGSVRFYVTGGNVFLLTKYSGYDPEVDTRRSTPLTPGVDYSAYPKSRSYVAGVNITF